MTYSLLIQASEIPENMVADVNYLDLYHDLENGDYNLLEVPINRFVPNPQMGIDIYFSPKILDLFKNNVDVFFERNGYSTSGYYIYKNFNNISFSTRPKESKFKNEIELADTQLNVINQIKDVWNEFFTANRKMKIQDNHDISIITSGIDISGHWKNFGFEIVPNTLDEQTNKINIIFNLEAERVAIKINDLSIQDQLHDFLGIFGGKELVLKTIEGVSPNFQIKIPMEIQVVDRKIIYSIGEISHNFQDLKLKSSFGELKIPEVEITIGWATSKFDKKEVENILNNNLENLTLQFQEKIQQMIDDGANKTLSNVLNENLNSYLDMETLDPFFTPDKKEDDHFLIENQDKVGVIYPNKYLLGYSLNNISMEKNHLKVSLATFMEDGKIYESSMKEISNKPKLNNKFLHNIPNYDIVTSVDLGILNRYIQLSCERGYFEKIIFGSDEENNEESTIEKEESTPLVVNVVGCPKIKLDEKENEIRLITKIRQNVEGWIEDKLIHNPLEIEFETRMKLELNKVTKQYSLVLVEIDEKSVNIEDKFIKLKPLKGLVLNAAKKEIQRLNKQYKNMVIEEEVAVPKSINGMPIQNLGYRLDKNGYIILYLKTIL